MSEIPHDNILYKALRRYSNVGELVTENCKVDLNNSLRSSLLMDDGSIKDMITHIQYCLGFNTNNIDRIVDSLETVGDVLTYLKMSTTPTFGGHGAM